MSFEMKIKPAPEVERLQEQWREQVGKISTLLGLQTADIPTMPHIPQGINLRVWSPILVVPPQEKISIELILETSRIHVSGPIEFKEDSEPRIVLMALKGYEKLPNDGENIRDANLAELASLLIQRPDLIKPGQHIFLKEHFSEGDFRYYKDSESYGSLTPALFSRYTPDDKTLRVMDL